MLFWKKIYTTMNFIEITNGKPYFNAGTKTVWNVCHVTHKMNCFRLCLDTIMAELVKMLVSYSGARTYSIVYGRFCGRGTVDLI